MKFVKFTKPSLPVLFVLFLIVTIAISSAAYAQATTEAKVVEKKVAVPISTERPAWLSFKINVVSADGSKITNAAISIIDASGAEYGRAYYTGSDYYTEAPQAGGFTVKVCAKGYSAQEKTYSSFPSETQTFTLSSKTETTKKIEGYVYESQTTTGSVYAYQYPKEIKGAKLANVPLKVYEEVCGETVETQKITSDSSGYFSAQVINNSRVCVDDSTKKYDYGCTYFSMDYLQEGSLYTKKLYQLTIKLSPDVPSEGLRIVISCASGDIMTLSTVYDIKLPQGAYDCDIFAYNMFNAGSTNLQTIEWGENSVNITLDKKATEIADKLPAINNSIKLKKGWNLVPFGVYYEGGTCSLSKDYVFVWDMATQSYSRASEIQNTYSEDFLNKVMYNSIWIYTTIPCQIPSEITSYSYSSGYFWGSAVASYIIANDMKLKDGWNLIFVTNDMINKSLNKAKGTCTITKSYTWNADAQSWLAIDQSKNFDTPYLSLAIKVSDDCAFELGPKPITEVEGFDYKQSKTETGGYGRGTTVTYTKNATEYRIMYLSMSLEKAKEMLGQTSAPKFSLMTLTVEGKSYNVYYGTSTSEAYTVWYSDGYLILTASYKYTTGYNKSDLLSLAKAYVTKYPPTSTIDITLLPSAPEFEEG